MSVQCVDPRFERRPGDVVYPVAGRHSAFWLDPAFQCEIRGVFRRLPVDDDENAYESTALSTEVPPR